MTTHGVSQVRETGRVNHASDASEASEVREAIDAFQRYTQAFQSLDPGAVARHYHEPALTITPIGLFPLPNAAAVEEVYARVMADLPSLGYTRTEFSPLTGRRLGDGLVVVSGDGTWKNATGEDLRRFGMTFTMRRNGDAWRIAVAMVHDPDPAR